MTDIFIVLSANLFITFFIKKFMSIFFQTDIDNPGKERAVYFIFFFLTTSVYLLFHFPPANILTNLLLIYFITQLYEGGQRKKILVSLLVYGINMFCDIIAVYSTSNYIVGEETNEISAYITVFLISICEFIIEKFLVKGRKTNLLPPYWSILIAIPVISIILMLLLIMSNLNNRMILVSISTGILFINLLIFNLYDVLVTAYLKLEESTVFERQIAAYSNQLSILMRSEEKVKGLRHDMKHHLNELSLLANRSGDGEIKNYLQNMCEYLENPCEYVSSGNQEVDSLINYMLNKAKTVLKKVDYDINIPQDLEINTFDLNVIVGNLLENAIEAAETSQRKWLELSLKYERKMLFIRIRNSYDHALRRQGDIYATGKRENGEHGIGLQNVKRMVESYRGVMQICDKDNVFDVKIILYTLREE